MHLVIGTTIITMTVDLPIVVISQKQRWRLEGVKVKRR
jgi:hypothetical protein